MDKQQKNIDNLPNPRDFLQTEKSRKAFADFSKKVNETILKKEKKLEKKYGKNT